MAKKCECGNIAVMYFKQEGKKKDMCFDCAQRLYGKPKTNFQKYTKSPQALAELLNMYAWGDADMVTPKEVFQGDRSDEACVQRLIEWLESKVEQ